MLKRPRWPSPTRGSSRWWVLLKAMPFASSVARTNALSFLHLLSSFPPLQGLVLIAFIIACVSASQVAASGQATGKAASFAAVWTVLLLVVVSIFGSMVFRRYARALPVGVLMGIIFVMVQQMLILFAFFAERSQQTNQLPSVIVSQQAMAVFAFFLFLVYGAFGSLLVVFRVDFIKEASGEDVPVEEEVEDEEGNGKADYQDN